MNKPRKFWYSEAHELPPPTPWVDKDLGDEIIGIIDEARDTKPEGPRKNWIKLREVLPSDKDNYWQQKYQEVVDELKKHTVVSDNGQFRADVIESIRGLAKSAQPALSKFKKEAAKAAFDIQAEIIGDYAIKIRRFSRALDFASNFGYVHDIICRVCSTTSKEGRKHDKHCWYHEMVQEMEKIVSGEKE